MVILDTTAAIDLLKNKKEVNLVIDKLIKDGEIIKITTISVMELWKGAELSINPVNQKNIIEDFLNSIILLDFTFKNSKTAGKIDAELTKKGEIIDIEDIMIASISKDNKEPILTRNVKHFKRIQDLEII